MKKGDIVYLKSIPGLPGGPRNYKLPEWHHVIADYDAPRAYEVKCLDSYHRWTIYPTDCMPENQVPDEAWTALAAHRLLS